MTQGCIVHWHGQGAYWRDDTGSAHEGERRAYCQAVLQEGMLTCHYHRTHPNSGCWCDLDEAEARIKAEQLGQITGGGL